ncbi:MAG: alpha-E domain-containing protein, partial [Ferrovibrio sp.]
LRQNYSRDYPSVRQAEGMLMKVRYGDIEAIFDAGLHEYLTETIDSNIELGAAIARDFMQPA